MNLALSDEQELLREAARNALARVKTVEAAREALEEGGRDRIMPDLWPTAIEAGWTGLVVAEERAAFVAARPTTSRTVGRSRRSAARAVPRRRPSMPAAR